MPGAFTGLFKNTTFIYFEEYTYDGVEEYIYDVVFPFGVPLCDSCGEELRYIFGNIVVSGDYYKPCTR